MASGICKQCDRTIPEHAEFAQCDVCGIVLCMACVEANLCVSNGAHCRACASSIDPTSLEEFENREWNRWEWGMATELRRADIEEAMR